MHQPVHPHSRNPDQTADGEETAVTEPPTGPFSASAENGYRPTSRTSVPNPYTTRSVDVDDVDTGANPVGQWRGVGLDEPEPRNPYTPATTDTMTDNPTPEGPTMPGSPTPGNTERPEAPVQSAAPASSAPEPAADHRSTPGQHTAREPHRPEAQLPEPQAPPQESQLHESQPRWPAAESSASGSQWEPQQAPYEPRRYADRPQAPYEPPHRDQARPQGAEQGQEHRPAGHDPQAPLGYQGHPDPNGYRDHQGYQQAQRFEQAQGYQQAQGLRGQSYPDPGHPGQGYPADRRGPQYPGSQYPGSQYPGSQYPGSQYSDSSYPGSPYPESQQGRPGHPGGPRGHQGQPPAPYPYPQAEYPPQPPVPPLQHYPVHYAHPQPLPYQSAYPLPYQPPGYVLPGQPVIYPGQFGAYGQPNPYGQPVQHVIVLAAGQQPQVVTAESAATLFAERSEPTVSQEVRQDKALTRSGTDEEAAPEHSEGAAQAQPSAKSPKQTDPAAAVDAPVAEHPAKDTAEETTEEKAEAAAAAKAEVAEAVSEALLNPEAGSGGRILNEALAGLAMRDLSLVDALLETVEALETDAQDPDLLDKLFQIDNFATRMRRNGENFLVLTGHDGGESDAHDEIVPLLDVARAATSEIKDYPRVSLGKLPQASITGLAADDISHLLAELLDNATANSPEHSQVVISARELEDGRLMIIVEDEGVGIPEDQLAELNGRLSGEPVLDDEVPKHMGLYVASRIAKKHGLETRLEPRSFRGLSAFTIVPKGLLRVATPRQPGQTRTSMIPSTSAPVTSTGPIPQQPANGKPLNGSGSNGGGANGNVAAGPGASKDAPPATTGGTSAVTAAGLPRRSATPHGSPLRMMPHPGALSETPPPPPKGREDTPPKLTGQARAEQIRDEIGDFLDGERAAIEGEELEGDKE
ncbi:hypothetical protein GCM10009642_24550 [Nocardiopsis metallicus]